MRAVFLDRDGILTRSFERGGRPYAPRTLDEFEILPEAAPALERLREAGLGRVVVTNQPDVGKGETPRETVEEMHRLLASALPLDSIRVSYATDDADPGRKPNPGMLFEAARDHGIDLARSYMVGDRWRDIGAGKAAGCHSILVGDGYGEVAKIPFDHQSESLAEAVAYILDREQGHSTGAKLT